MKYERLFSPLNIGSVKIKNRIVMPAMMLGHGRFDGRPTERMLDYYEERAKGGAGLIITEITRVNDITGAGALAQLAVSHDYHIEPLKGLVLRIHRHDCKIFIQLHHPGRQNMPILMGTLPIAVAMERISPKLRNVFYKITPAARKLQERGMVFSVTSPSKTEPCRFSKGRNRALSHREIKKLIGQFMAGAKRAQQAGADGVELHAAHGYLIQEFLSPLTNHRKDEYGGSLENRMRFLLEIIEGVKRECGEDFPIIVRLSVDECYDRIGEPGKGYGLAEGIAMAKRLEAAGIAALDVSSGSYETMNYWLEPVSFEPGWRSYMAAAVKKEVSIPIIAANLIRSAGQAEEQLAAGIQDFVALGRPHLADPCWAVKVMEGREEEIKRCICCQWCFESMLENAYAGKAGGCAVNPHMGREKEYLNLKKNGYGRKVIVAGAGPAGLTAGEILAERGFEVIVYEKNAMAGGQAHLASLPLKKGKIAWCYEDLKFSAEKKGVRILWNTEATPELILREKPYGVIVASGGSFLRPSKIKGIDGQNVCTVKEVLNGEVRLKGRKVAIIGSGMTGLETAEKLAEDGNSVVVVEMAGKVGSGAFGPQLDDILPRLAAHKVEFQTGFRLMEIWGDHIVVEASGEKAARGSKDVRRISVDFVVPALGVKSENSLYLALLGKQENLYVAGDADKPGRIANATAAAARIAESMNGFTPISVS